MVRIGRRFREIKSNIREETADAVSFLEDNMKTEQKSLLQKNWMVCLLAGICCLLWGSAFPCIKIGYQWFHIAADDVPSQILFAGCRFTLAGILTILIGSALGKKWLVPKKASVGMVVKLSLLQTVLQYLFFYIGLANTTGVKASIIEASNVFVAILVSGVILRLETVSSRKWLGCLIGFLGVVLVNLSGTGLGGDFRFDGEGFIFLSTVSYAFSIVCMKRYSQKEDPVLLSGYQFLAGGLLMAAAGALMGGRVSGFTPGSVLLLVYMAVISAVAYSLWGMLLKYNPVAKVTVFGFMNPVFGVILSALILGETNQAFSLQGLAALLLVCLGIYLVNKEQKP